MTADGNLRVRSKGGWSSERAPDGSLLLVHVSGSNIGKSDAADKAKESSGRRLAAAEAARVQARMLQSGMAKASTASPKSPKPVRRRHSIGVSGASEFQRLAFSRSLLTFDEDSGACNGAAGPVAVDEGSVAYTRQSEVLGAVDMAIGCENRVQVGMPPRPDHSVWHSMAPPG